MARNLTAARRMVTLALALAATTGIGTAVATGAHAAHQNPVAAIAKTEIRAIENTAETAVAYNFETHVSNAGEQDAIDACEGGLTLMESVTEWIGKGYYPIHNDCGGRPILFLNDGDTVHVDELGDFVVVDTLDVMRGDDATAIENLGGDILIQTCHDTGDGMRVVALESISF